MNTNTVNTALLDILQSTKEVGTELYNAAKIGLPQLIDVLQVQAPEIVNEIIVVNRVYLTSVMVAGLIVIVFSAYVISKKLKTFGDDFASTLLVSGLAILVFAIGGHMADDFINLCTVWFAPKLFLIEYISKLI